jgi:hypothetical protein
LKNSSCAATIQCAWEHFSYCEAAHPRSLEGTLGEGHFIWFPATSPFSFFKELSCRGFQVTQLLTPPRNHSWWESHPGWTILVIGGENGLCTNSAANSTPHTECTTLAMAPGFTFRSSRQDSQLVLLGLRYVVLEISRSPTWNYVSEIWQRGLIRHMPIVS